MKTSDISFKKLSEFNIERYKKIVSHYVPYSDHNYTSLFCWDTKNRCEVAELPQNGLLIRMDNYLDDPESEFLFTIAGQTNSSDITNILKNLDPKVSVDLIPPYVVHRLERSHTHNIKFQLDRDNFDYIISTDKYSALAGGAYTNKRKKINNFLNTYESSLTVNEIALRDIEKDEVFSLYEKWKTHNTGGGEQSDGELLALRKLLENVWLENCFEFICLEYRLNGILCGFSISEKTTKQYSVGHFMKADLSYRYLFDYIAYHTTKYLNEKYSVKFFNIEQDLGIEGLRTYKERHNPHKFLKKYRLNRR